MNNLPPELIDLICNRLNNSLWHKTQLCSWAFDVIGTVGLRWRKYSDSVVQKLCYDGDLEGVKFVLDVVKPPPTPMNVLKNLQRYCSLHYSSDKSRRSLINWASYNGHTKIVKYLYSLGEDCTPQGMDAACRNGHLEVVKYLSKIGKDCSFWAMEGAARNGHLEIVKFLYSIGKNDIAYPFLLACGNGQLAIVKYFHSVRQLCPRRAAIDSALLGGHTAVVKFLRSIKNE